MIELVNVSKYYPTEFGRHYVFRDVTLSLPLNINVAVIGPNGAGKSTFLRLLGGADTPSEGRILRSGRISPPMGLTPGLQATMTGTENTRFACRIYGMSRDETNETIAKVQALAGIGKFFDMPVRTYSAGMRQRVGFAISMSMYYDYYLFDEISAGGDTAFRETAQRMVQERLNTSNFIIASHRLDEMAGLCQACILIKDGELTYYEDIQEAVSLYQLVGADYIDESLLTKPKRALGQDVQPEDAAATGTAGTAVPASPGETVLLPAEAKAQARLERRRQNRARRQAEAPPSAPLADDVTAAKPQSGETPPPVAQVLPRAERRVKRSARAESVAADKPEAPQVTSLPPSPEQFPGSATAKLARRAKRLAKLGPQENGTALSGAVEAAPALQALETAGAETDPRSIRLTRRAKRLAKRGLPEGGSASPGESESPPHPVAVQPTDAEAAPAPALASALQAARLAQFMALLKSARAHRLLIRLLDEAGSSGSEQIEHLTASAVIAQQQAAEAASQARLTFAALPMPPHAAVNFTPDIRPLRRLRDEPRRSEVQPITPWPGLNHS